MQMFRLEVSQLEVVNSMIIFNRGGGYYCFHQQYHRTRGPLGLD